MSEPAKHPRNGSVSVEAEELLTALCPRDGSAQRESGGEGRFLVCPKCRYVFDSWLSREARYDEWDSATWFLKPKQKLREIRRGLLNGLRNSGRRVVMESEGKRVVESRRREVL